VDACHPALAHIVATGEGYDGFMQDAHITRSERDLDALHPSDAAASQLAASDVRPSEDPFDDNTRDGQAGDLKLAEHAGQEAAREAVDGSAAPLGLCRTPELDQLWRALREFLRKRVQRQQFETWFRRAALVQADEHCIRLAVQNTFTRDWLLNYYKPVLAEAVQELCGAQRELYFVVDAELCMSEPEEAQREAERGADAGRSRLDGSATGDPDLPPYELPAAEPQGARPARDDHSAQLSARRNAIERRARDESGNDRDGNFQTRGERNRSLREQIASGERKKPGLLRASDVVLNPSYRFDNFVVGPCNRFAHAAAQGVSESPAAAYNPFFLHGAVGLGKTHLLQSLCHALLEREPDTSILYLSCETFVNHFISALENGDLQKFRTKYRNVDVLVVDDIHLLANKERTQEEFFHTFNTLYNAGKQIVLSSDSPPKEIPTLQARLVSRFKWGLVTEIEPPCFETRMAILKRKSRDRGQELDDEIARMVAERIDTNIRELEGAVTKVLGYASLSSQPVTPELVRQCLREVFVDRRAQPSMEDILRVVTEHFGVRLSDLQSRKRTAAIAYPRQIGMYLARKITRLSLEEIGGFFGGRDHSTVLYGVQKIDGLTREDPSLADLLIELRSRLRSDSV